MRNNRINSSKAIATIIKPPSSNNGWKYGFPPYYLAALEAYLSGKLTVKTEDLEIKMWEYNFGKNKADFLSLFSMKAVLEHCLKIEDRGILEASNRILKIASVNSPSAVFYIQYPNEFLVALPLAKLLKSRKKKIIFAGEFFATIYERIINTYDFIDYIVYDSVAYSLKLLLAGGKDNIPNIFWKGKAVGDDLNFRYSKDFFKEFPAPSFDTLPLKTYKAYLETYFGIDEPVLSYRLSQGCVNRCFFCSISKYDKFNFKDAATVSADLFNLSRRYNCRFFHFLDNSFTISNKYTKELCKKIISGKPGIEFMGMSQVEYLDEEAIRLLKEAGCQALFLGIESVSLKGVYLLKKNRDLKKFPRILELCKKNGIWVHLFFMSGFPFQRLSDVSGDLDFIKHNRELIDSILINDFQLHINSDICNYPAKFGIRSIGSNFLPYRIGVPYSPKNENHLLYLRIFKELFTKLGLNNLDPLCLSFLFNPALKEAVVNNADKFLSVDSEEFLEKCRVYLKEKSRFNQRRA
jgi:radical SAM superfamily enzyme YgiQ (UPF0313 family)